MKCKCKLLSGAGFPPNRSGDKDWEQVVFLGDDPTNNKGCGKETAEQGRKQYRRHRWKVTAIDNGFVPTGGAWEAVEHASERQGSRDICLPIPQSWTEGGSWGH